MNSIPFFLSLARYIPVTTLVALHTPAPEIYQESDWIMCSALIVMDIVDTGVRTVATAIEPLPRALR